MWRVRSRDRRTVTCPACGASLPRADAREYDKHGDRWDRRGKTFEYLCKPCHARLCHQGRDGLEALLVALDAGRVDRDTFLRLYASSVRERSDAVGEP